MGIAIYENHENLRFIDLVTKETISFHNQKNPFK